MITTSRTPTRLIDPALRPRIEIRDPHPPSRLRGLDVVVGFGGLLWRLLALRLRGEFTPAVAGSELRKLFERLGGLWIKAGQLLSLRIDLFPAELCRELARLQNSSVGVPTPIARQIVEAELGAPIEQYFDEFGERPFAVASIGQVYRARLRQEQVFVAVKVQKPYVAELFARDFVVIGIVVRLMRILRVYSHMRWDLGLQELREVMDEELNFFYEASSLRRMRRTLRPHGLLVPKLYSRYCTRRLLVTEFVHGVLMADVIKVSETDPGRLAAWMTENNIRPRRVAQRLIQSLFRQLFEDNLYHGDLHPGNIVLLRDSRIALIDFGTTSFTEREYLDRFRMFVHSLARRDYAKAADVCLMLTFAVPHIDLEPVKEKLIRSLRSWTTRTLVRELPYHEKSLDNATVAVVKVLVNYKCTMEWAWLRIHRAFTTLDVSLVHLYPDVNYSRRLQRYFRDADTRALRALYSAESARRVLRAVRTSLDIQERVNEYTMFQSQLIRRHAQVFKGATGKFSTVMAAIVFATTFAAGSVGVFAGLVYLTQYHGTTVAPVIGQQLAAAAERVPRLDPQIWGFVLIMLSYAFVRLYRLNRRLRQAEPRQAERVAPL
jgi:ubiquinone biosynthesis protein